MWVDSIGGSKLTLAFKLRDSFDDKILKDEFVNFYINDIPVTIMQKYECYYVIMNIEDKCFYLKIRSHNYYDKIIFIDLDNIEDADKCIEIYLIPHYKYLNSPSKYYIDGVADAMTQVVATKLSNRSNIRYKTFDLNRMMLDVLNPIKESLSGHFMAIVDCTHNIFQSFFIRYKILDDQYKIDEIIDSKFKPLLPIQKAYITNTNDLGQYKLYLNDNCLQDETYIISYFKNDKNILKTVNIKL